MRAVSNQTRQPTPVVRLACSRAPSARRALAFCYQYTGVEGLFIALLLSITAACAADSVTNNAEAAQVGRLRERISEDLATTRAKMLEHGMTNGLPAQDGQTVDALYRLLVVTPSFGLSWDEVPAPNLKGVDAMKAVSSFILTNGWDSWTCEELLFGPSRGREKMLTGLPWKEIRDRPFNAGTHGGILYVPLRGFGPDSTGVACNPQTNLFPASVNKFKPIGDHWYVWTQTQSPPGAQQYEGQKP